MIEQQPSRGAVVAASLAEAAQALERFQADIAAREAIASAGETLAKTIRCGGTIYSCGNGGSMCDAMHFAEELTGRYREAREPIAALAISDPSHLSCVANDFGYDAVFSRFLEAHGRPGDSLVALSTSGGSANVLRAAETGRKRGVTVVALTGRPGSPLADLCDVEICAGVEGFADRAQEIHIKILHILIDLIEREMHSEQPA